MKTNRNFAILILCSALFAFGICYLTTGCSTTGPTSSGAILADASSLDAQLQAAAPALETDTGAGPKTTADVTAGLWALQVGLQAMEGQPATIADLDTGIPVVNKVVSANLGSGNVTAQDVAKVGSLITQLTQANP